MTGVNLRDWLGCSKKVANISLLVRKTSLEFFFCQLAVLEFSE